MRKMDSDGLMMCRMQGKMFEKSVTKVNLSSPLFIRKYMNSVDARGMDICVYLDLGRFDDQILEDLNAEKPRGKIKYDTKTLYWMGYIYRYWSYVYEMSSKSIYKAFPGTKLAKLYHVYHTFDPLYAVDRIIEVFNIKVVSDVHQEYHAVPELDEELFKKSVSLMEEQLKGFKLDIK